MTRRGENFALGLTTIALLALVLGTVLFLYPALRGGGRAVEIHFRHEDGMAPLKAGSMVLLADAVDVGRVRSVQIREYPATASQPARTVFVVAAEIREDVPLYGECRITTNQPAIGGSGYLSILRVGTPGKPLKEPIEGLPPQTFQAAIGTLSGELPKVSRFIDLLSAAADPEVEGSVLHKMLVSLDDLNAMTGELRTQLRPQEQQALLYKVHAILDELNLTTAALRGELVGGDEGNLLAKVHLGLDRLGEGLAEATAMLKEGRPLVRDTLASVEHATRTIDQEVLADLEAQLDPNDPASLLAKIHVSIDCLNASLEDLHAITTAGEHMLARNRPALERTVGNLKATSAELLHGVQELALNPSRLLWGPGSQRGKQQLAFLAARSFAAAASDLDDAAEHLEGVLQTLPPSGQFSETEAEELRQIRAAVRATFERFQQAEETFWEELK